MDSWMLQNSVRGERIYVDIRMIRYRQMEGNVGYVGNTKLIDEHVWGMRRVS